MVFGIFAAHRSADEELMVEARTELVANYRSFLDDQGRREEVVRLAAGKIGLTPDRMDQYFLSEVSNLLDEESVEGLSRFLVDVCGMEPSVVLGCIHSVAP